MYIPNHLAKRDEDPNTKVIYIAIIVVVVVLFIVGLIARARIMSSRAKSGKLNLRPGFLPGTPAPATRPPRHFPQLQRIPNSNTRAAPQALGSTHTPSNTNPAPPERSEYTDPTSDPPPIYTADKDPNAPDLPPDLQQPLSPPDYPPPARIRE